MICCDMCGKEIKLYGSAVTDVTIGRGLSK